MKLHHNKESKNCSHDSQDNLIILYEKSADSFNELINQAKEILEKHGMNGTPSYHDGGNSISF